MPPRTAHTRMSVNARVNVERFWETGTGSSMPSNGPAMRAPVRLTVSFTALHVMVAPVNASSPRLRGRRIECPRKAGQPLVQVFDVRGSLPRPQPTRALE